MKNIVLIRIDDRLIHGQVVTQWIKDTNGNRILIVDDKLVNDRMMMRILKAAEPPGVKVEVMTVADAETELKQDAVPGENIVILVKVPLVQEDIDESENMSVEEVEAAFEIEETEQEEENISADEVPLFKQRDREY